MNEQLIDEHPQSPQIDCCARRLVFDNFRRQVHESAANLFVHIRFVRSGQLVGESEVR